VLGALAIGLTGSVVQAQTRFEWPKDTVDIALYTTVEDCLAATLLRHVGGDAWRDTLPATTARLADDARAPLPEHTAAAARRCGARFPAASAQLTDFAPLLVLYLAAGRDAGADTLVRRRLAAVSPANERARGAVLDTVIHVYLGRPAFGSAARPLPLFTQPARLAAAEPLVTQLGLMKSMAWQTRLENYSELMNRAWDEADTARARRMAQASLALASGLTDAERRSVAFQQASAQIEEGLLLLNKVALLDSLRHSTAAYGAFYRSLWGKVTGNGPMPAGVGQPIGEAAPSIDADFWFGRGDSTAPRPSKGKVALVVFLEQQLCFFGANRPTCQATYAQLRRLGRQFPALEITLVAQTQGWFDKAAPPAPAEEATLLDHAWLEERHLPGALAITTTPFWRIADPDRRRINRDLPNSTHYAFGRSAAAGLLNAGLTGVFLVDQDGAVISASALNEQDLPELIAILLARPATSQS
jgi:hypothetical protein